MCEKYLKWILLREIIGEHMDDEYDVEKMKADYKRLTEELLSDYKK